jgi:hypothetical protein
MRSGDAILLSALLVAPMFLISIPAHANDLNVPDDFPTIQAALDAAVPGDTVRVAPGTYLDAFRYRGKAVSVVAQKGPDVTTLKAPTIEIGPGGELSGFTIARQPDRQGWIITPVGAGSLIRDNVFDLTGMRGIGSGLAINGNAASPVIERNLFMNGVCDNQFSSGIISFGNQSSPRIVNNLLVNNDCRAINLRLPEGSLPQVINNTIVRNRTGVRVTRLVQAAPQVYRNNLIVGNGVGLQADFETDAFNPTWENNLVFGNGTDYAGLANQTGQAGNLSQDPLFRDPDGMNFRLRAGSPAIDTGSEAAAPDVDFERDMRPVDGNKDGAARTDIGFDEFVEGVKIEIAGGREQECASKGGTSLEVLADVTVQLGDDVSEVHWSVDGVEAASGTPASVFVPLGAHSLRVVVTTVLGKSLENDLGVRIVDTTPPVGRASFIDSRTGLETTEISGTQASVIRMEFDVTDICDPDPATKAFLGSSVADGDTIRVQGKTGATTLGAGEWILSVTGTDASSNTGHAEARLRVR